MIYEPPLPCVFYRHSQGGEPVREWLRDQKRDVRLAIGSDIQLVQWRWPTSRPLVGALGNGVYEVRTTHRGNQYRVLFCVERNHMVLLHAFQKKTQKVPLRDLEIARGRYREVLHEES